MSHYEKKKREKKKIHWAAQFLPQNLQVFKRGMRKKFLKGAKYSPPPFLHPYITTPNPYTTYYSPPTIQPIHMHILIWLYDLFIWIRSLTMQ
jgi:hypothetical protein